MKSIIFFLLLDKTYISIIWFQKSYMSLEAYKHNFPNVIYSSNISSIFLVKY